MLCLGCDGDCLLPSWSKKVFNLLLTDRNLQVTMYLGFKERTWTFKVFKVLKVIGTFKCPGVFYIVILILTQDLGNKKRKVYGLVVMIYMSG